MKYGDKLHALLGAKKPAPLFEVLFHVTSPIRINELCLWEERNPAAGWVTPMKDNRSCGCRRTDGHPYIGQSPLCGTKTGRRGGRRRLYQHCGFDRRESAGILAPTKCKYHGRETVNE